MERITEDNIKAILLAGESNTVEFKTRVGSAIKVLPRIISAFANTEGGAVIFGYDERHQSIIGTTIEDYDIVKKVILRNKLEEVSDVYTVEYEGKSLIIVQVEKAESMVIAGGGAYIRKGDTNISVLNSKDVVSRIVTTVETSESMSSKESFERLEKKLEQIYDELLRSQKEHEEELKEQEIVHKKELKDSKISNWFFCILSAIIGYGLSIIF